MKTKDNKMLYCGLPEHAERALSEKVTPHRARLIRVSEKKWVNGTVLHYYFFTGNPWGASGDEKSVVREAFKIWKNVGIGLDFREVSSPDDSMIRIGFLQGDGAWSYVGRDLYGIEKDQRTMNFGWKLSGNPKDLDTPVHEIGHSLGFPHEHQNPNAGIVWDEEAVYRELAGPPNYWSRQKTHYNIIRKINPDTVQGSKWDPDSIMHYPFGPGLIAEPEDYKNGLYPEPGLSARDREWVKKFYPSLSNDDYRKLTPFSSVQLKIDAGEQMNFIIEPGFTRNYKIQTFGESDTVMVLFQEENGEEIYVMADDDSGEDFNAHIETKLFKGKRYILRLRLYYAYRSGETAVMLW